MREFRARLDGACVPKDGGGFVESESEILTLYPRFILKQHQLACSHHVAPKTEMRLFVVVVVVVWHSANV